MIINSSTLPLYETHGINGIFGIIGINERAFNSPNNTNSTNNTNKPCYRGGGTNGRKAAKRTRPPVCRMSGSGTTEFGLELPREILFLGLSGVERLKDKY